MNSSAVASVFSQALFQRSKFVSNRVPPVRRTCLDGGQDDVGIKIGKCLGGIAAPLHPEREGSTHDLHVLLRHRLRSISRRGAEIASREEVLAMLTEKARECQAGAMIALGRALRAVERKERQELDNELDRLLTK